MRLQGCTGIWDNVVKNNRVARGCPSRFSRQIAIWDVQLVTPEVSPTAFRVWIWTSRSDARSSGTRASHLVPGHPLLRSPFCIGAVARRYLSTPLGWEKTSTSVLSYLFRTRNSAPPKPRASDRKSLKPIAPTRSPSGDLTKCRRTSWHRRHFETNITLIFTQFVLNTLSASSIADPSFGVLQRLT